MINNAVKCGVAALGFMILPGAVYASLVPPGSAPVASAPLIRVVDYKDHHWRRHHHRHHHHWRGNGRRGHHWRHGSYDDGFNPGAAVAIGLIGSLIANGVSDDGAHSAIDRCDARYRSFNRSTGLYTTYGGEKRLCPYLR